MAGKNGGELLRPRENQKGGHFIHNLVQNPPLHNTNPIARQFWFSVINYTTIAYIWRTFRASDADRSVKRDHRFQHTYLKQEKLISTIYRVTLLPQFTLLFEPHSFYPATSIFHGNLRLRLSTVVRNFNHHTPRKSLQFQSQPRSTNIL